VKKSSPLNVFFDSDVIIAGSFSKTGASHILLQLAEVGVIQGYISEQIIQECTRNIRKKLPEALSVFQFMLDASFLNVVVQVDPTQAGEKARGQANDKDVPILAAALKARADVLVTFNTKDYFPHESPLKILTPGDLLKDIQRRAGTLDVKR